MDNALWVPARRRCLCQRVSGQKVSLFKCLCVSPWGHSKHPPLSCVALRNYGGFWAPGWLGRRGGAPRLSLKLPICFFPHCRLAKQHDPPPLPWVRSLSTPGQLWSDGQKKMSERALGTLRLVHVCDGIADWKPGGWLGSFEVKGRCPSRFRRLQSSHRTMDGQLMQKNKTTPT